MLATLSQADIVKIAGNGGGAQALQIVLDWGRHSRIVASVEPIL
ncbi:hypothetical protein [Mycetohabitans endofungorum]|nr:hypothetical protein [Mycetohabitans endofungorum]